MTLTVHLTRAQAAALLSTLLVSGEQFDVELPAHAMDVQGAARAIARALEVDANATAVVPVVQPAADKPKRGRPRKPRQVEMPSGQVRDVGAPPESAK
jgi:hypothetical protein